MKCEQCGKEFECNQRDCDLIDIDCATEPCNLCLECQAYVKEGRQIVNDHAAEEHWRAMRAR